MEALTSARNAAAWQPEKGTMLAVAAAEGDVTLYDRHSWQPCGTLTGGHTQPITTLAFSSDGGACASCLGPLWHMHIDLCMRARLLSCAQRSLLQWWFCWCCVCSSCSLVQCPVCCIYGQSERSSYLSIGQ